MTGSSRVASIAFALLAVTFVVRCDEPSSVSATNTLPIEESSVAAEWLKGASKGWGPAVVISRVGERTSEDAYSVEVRLVLINPTERILEYRGYPIDFWSESPPLGEISPLYRLESREGFGAWQNAGPGWCGLGAEAMQVPAGHAAEFVAHVPRGETMRVGVPFELQSAPTMEGFTAWSPAIDSREETNRSRTP